MRSNIAGQLATNEIALNVHPRRHSARRRQVILAAAGALALATSAFGQTTQPVYMDQNGTTSGLGSGTVTWNATNTNWATGTAGTTDVAWTPGDVANFSGGTGNPEYTVDLQDSETPGGFNFNTGGVVITTVAGTTGEQLNINSGSYSPSTNTGGVVINDFLAAAGRQVIAVPIVGSGDMVINSYQNNGSDTVDLAGVMSGFSGNIYINDLVAPAGTTKLSSTFNAQVQVDAPVSGGTIYLDQWASLLGDNQIGTPVGATESGNAEAAGVYSGTAGDYSTGTLAQATPNIFTIGDNIVLNYNGASPGTATYNTIGAPNGPTINGVKYQKIITYSGAISSPAGVTAGLVISGGNGTTVLSGANTYTGNTYVALLSSTNGFFQLGAANTLPATGWLVLGSNFNFPLTTSTSATITASVVPTDLSGNSQTIAGLQTGNSGTTSVTVGNIYNLQIVNTNYPVMANGQPSGSSGIGYQTNPNGNAATITITPLNAQSTVFNGDIGDTNVGAGTGATVAPFTNNAPYSDGVTGGAEYVTALTNVSLVLNGPTSGSGNAMLTLAPVDTYSGGNVTGLANGNEYAGNTTINSNATLVFGRGYDKQTPAAYTGGVGIGVPPGNYTITGGGNVVVNSGGTLASLGGTFVSGKSSGAGFTIGGAAGTIILNSGSSFLPGEGLITGNQGASTTTTVLSPNNVGTLATGNIQFDAGAAMTFSIASATSYDYVFLYGGLSLDDPNNSNHLINIDLTSGGTISPGIYTLINSGGGVGGTASSYTLGGIGSLPSQYALDKFSLLVGEGGDALQLLVSAPALQWDPLKTGATNAASGQPVTESSGEWTDGNGSDGAPATWFYNQITGQETQWSNSATMQVLIGDSANQPGGQITLGNNIVVSSANGIEFGPVQAGNNYSIINANGNSYTLSIGSGGIAIQNATATSTTPSAEIDVPVILDASQTWNVPSGQFLNVTGSVTENDSTPSYTLTVTGGGVVDLSGNNGSIGTLAVNDSSIVLLSSGTAIGNAAVNLNGGGVEFSLNGSPTNAITIGAAGGAMGATTGFSVVYSPNISTANGFEAIGTGTTTFNGTVSVGALQVSAFSGSTLGAIHFANNVTDSGTLSVTGGNAYFDAVTSITGTSSFTGGNIYLDNPNAGTTPNTFTGGITIAGGTVYAQSSNALGNATITFSGAAGGGLDIAGAATLANALNGTGSGAATGGNSYGDTVYMDLANPLTLTGSLEGTGDLRFYPATGTSGSTPQLILNEASTRNAGGAIYYNVPNLDLVLENAGAMGLSTQSFMTSTPTTIDVEVPVAVSGDLRGEPTTSGGASVLNIIKTGPGILALNGAASSSTPGTLNINQGEVEITATTGLGGGNTTVATMIVGVNITGPTSVFGLDISNATRTGGAYTLNNGGTLRRDNVAYTETITGTTGTIASNGFSGESDIVAATAADVITISGTGGTIEDGAIQGSGTNGTTTNTLFTMMNPVVVNTGATLNLQNDNTGGYDTSYILAFRGPTAATNDYDTLTVQAGATVTTDNGPGQVRFGRTASQGVPIIAQGTPGSESTLKLGVAGGDDDVYMTTNNGTAGNYNTIFVVEGTGTAGLRIEAPMDATYQDVTAAGATPLTPEGTTGLFGVNNTVTAGTLPSGLAVGFYGSISNAYTVMSPARLAALSSYTYTDSSSTVHTVTPTGTLTLAANDQVSVSGAMLGGPGGTSVTQLSLALDNTAPVAPNTSLTGITYTYQINPAANTAGGTFANFAGLTVERSHSNGAQVTAQLLGNTKTPSLTLTGGTRVDITNQALVVDPATGPAPTAAIAALLQSAYDHGNWDGPGIGSSSFTNGTALLGSSIGYAENDLLPTPYDNVSNFFGGASGQPVDNNAVLVRYTWLGDLNLDGVVNSTDFTMMGALGTSNVGWMGGDLNYDGVVNADDWALFMLGDAAQTGQLTSFVPEPGAMSLLAIGAGAMLRRKRRI